MKLSEEQIVYLKSLDSKKKRRKFLLDCLVDSVISESEKIDTRKISDLPRMIISDATFHSAKSEKEEFEPIIFNGGSFTTDNKETYEWLKNFERCSFTSTTTAPRTFQGIFGRMSNIKEEKDGSITFDLPSYNETKDEFDKKCDELLKFDMLKDEDKNKFTTYSTWLDDKMVEILEEEEFLKSNGFFKVTGLNGVSYYGKSKSDESANSEKKEKSIEQQAFDIIYPENKYTEEDMNEYALFIHKNYVITPSEWFDKFKKEKEND